MLTSTGSWPSILPSGELSPWPIRTTWYCGIVLSLFSILTAADQTVRLHRLSSHRDGLDNLRKLLSKTIRQRDCKAQTRLQPSLLQVVTWQMPVMFLTSATICMIVGLFLHIWSATPHVGRMGHWDDDSKVCCCDLRVGYLTDITLCRLLSRTPLLHSLPSSCSVLDSLHYTPLSANEPAIERHSLLIASWTIRFFDRLPVLCLVGSRHVPLWTDRYPLYRKSSGAQSKTPP